MAIMMPTVAQKYIFFSWYANVLKKQKSGSHEWDFKFYE